MGAEEGLSARYLFHFAHGGKVKTFGPHRDWAEANDAFQFRYGYWPTTPLGSDLYSGTEEES